MDGKKISFGFKKTKKVEVSLPKTEDEEEREYIECVEEQSIKIIGGEAGMKKQELVIPMQPNTLSVSERMKQIANEVEMVSPEATNEVASQNNSMNTDLKPNETLEEAAARELLQEALSKQLHNEEIKCVEVPMPALPKLDGSKEPTLDDYEEVPVGDFGLAMLRGMGWKPGQEKKYIEPQLRPKGLGLGADRASKKSKHRNDEESLKLIKGCFVKLNGGNLSGSYAKVVGFDEDSGRVILELSFNKGNSSVNEEMVEVISKAEYDSQYRVINKDKYEEYKRNEDAKKRHKPTDCPLKKSNTEATPGDRCKKEEKKVKIEPKPQTEDVNKRSHNHSSHKSKRNERKREHTPENSRLTSLNSKRDSRDNSPMSVSKNRHKRKGNGEDSERNSRKKRSTDISSNTSEDDSDYKSSKRRHFSQSTDDADDSSYRRESDKKRKGKKKRRDRSRSRPRQGNMKRKR